GFTSPAGKPLGSPSFILFAFSLLRTEGLRESKYAPGRSGSWELSGSAILTKTCPEQNREAYYEALRQPREVSVFGNTVKAAMQAAPDPSLCYLGPQGGSLTTHERSTVLPISH